MQQVCMPNPRGTVLSEIGVGHSVASGHVNRPKVLSAAVSQGLAKDRLHRIV